MMCEKRHIWRASGGQKNTSLPEKGGNGRLRTPRYSKRGGVCHAHPNGPCQFIIAHLFENVKGLRQKNLQRRRQGQRSCTARPLTSRYNQRAQDLTQTTGQTPGGPPPERRRGPAGHPMGPALPASPRRGRQGRGGGRGETHARSLSAAGAGAREHKKSPGPKAQKSGGSAAGGRGPPQGPRARSRPGPKPQSGRPRGVPAGPRAALRTAGAKQGRPNRETRSGADGGPARQRGQRAPAERESAHKWPSERAGGNGRGPAAPKGAAAIAGGGAAGPERTRPGAGAPGQAPDAECPKSTAGRKAQPGQTAPATAGQAAKYRTGTGGACAGRGVGPPSFRHSDRGAPERGGKGLPGPRAAAMLR